MVVSVVDAMPFPTDQTASVKVCPGREPVVPKAIKRKDLIYMDN